MPYQKLHAGAVPVPYQKVESRTSDRTRDHNTTKISTRDGTRDGTRDHHTTVTQRGTACYLGFHLGS